MIHLKLLLFLWSFKAPAKISEADAVKPLLIKIITGLPLIPSPFLAKYFRFSLKSLPLVDTISPSFKKKSLILIAWVNSPPGLFLKSIIYPIGFLFFQIFYFIK